MPVGVWSDSRQGIVKPATEQEIQAFAQALLADARRGESIVGRAAGVALTTARKTGGSIGVLAAVIGRRMPAELTYRQLLAAARKAQAQADAGGAGRAALPAAVGMDNPPDAAPPAPAGLGGRAPRNPDIPLDDL